MEAQRFDVMAWVINRIWPYLLIFLAPNITELSSTILPNIIQASSNVIAKQTVCVTDSPVSQSQAPLKLMNSKTSMAAGLAYHSHRKTWMAFQHAHMLPHGKLWWKRRASKIEEFYQQTPDSNERNTNPQNASCLLIQYTLTQEILLWYQLCQRGILLRHTPNNTQ